jgi:hydroxymethylpyrimidine/phosphomethylpyrimidine kinase
VTTPPVALTIAGSDSSGGAGIHADLRTFAAHGVHGASAIAAVTAQNTLGVQGVHVLPGSFVVAQIESVLDDLDVRATKTGMLATEDNVRAVGALAADGRLPHLVVDPVMVASSGARLLDPGAESAYVEALIPHCAVVTPNRAEAAVLVGHDVTTVDDMAAAGRALVALGPALVVVTGGDSGDRHGAEAVDVVVTAEGTATLRAPWIETSNHHGTGCSLASAVASGLALGDDPSTSVRKAKAYVHRALAGAADWHLGAGPGPLDHLGWNRPAADPQLREEP